MNTHVSRRSRLPRALRLLAVSAVVGLLLAGCSSSRSSKDAPNRRLECQAAGIAPATCKSWIPD